MDALTRLLDGPRGRGAYLVRALMQPPWALRVQDRAPVGLVSVLRGTAWIGSDGGECVSLGPGDVAVMRGPDAFTFADDTSTRPQLILHQGGRVTRPDGADVTQTLDLGGHSWGNDPDGSTVMLLGCYQLRGEVSTRLLTALPTVLVLRAGGLDTPLVPLLVDELGKDGPGQDAVLDRLFDLVLVTVLRAWFARVGADRPSWFRAYGDPVVGRALQMLHEHPERPWTVAALASDAGVSRAALARRFTDVVGEPPMTYLTGWRLALAADQLRNPDATLEAVARAVGYGSGFALSTAFKRERGISPSQHRAQEAPAAPGPGAQGMRRIRTGSR